MLVAATLDTDRRPLVAVDADAEANGAEPRARVARVQAHLDAAARGGLARRKDALVGLAANGADRLLAHSHGCVLTVDTTAKAPRDARAPPPPENEKKKRYNPFRDRKRARENDGADAAAAGPHAPAAGPGWTLSTRYTPVLGCAWLDDAELLVCENPWLDLANAVDAPKPIARKRFGT